MAFFSCEKKVVVTADCGDIGFGFGICGGWVFAGVGTVCLYVVLGRSE